MATYTIDFHDRTTAILDSYTIEVSCKTRYLTNRSAIAIAQTLYAAAAYGDQDSREALWAAAGNSAEAYLDRLLGMDVDWSKGAATMQYPHFRRSLTAVFTLDAELGAKLCPSENLFMTDAEKGFSIAFQAARSSR